MDDFDFIINDLEEAINIDNEVYHFIYEFMRGIRVAHMKRLTEEVDMKRSVSASLHRLKFNDVS